MVLQNKIGQNMFDKISRGDIQSLSPESLESFLSVYPKEDEIELLR